MPRPPSRIRRAVAICLVLALGLTARAATNAFHFVQITDTHIGTEWHHERLGKIVESINRLPMPIACVIHTGDIASDNIDKQEQIQEGLDILARLRPPLHVVPGNHDILPARLQETLGAYRKNVGPLAAAVKYHGVRFLLVYTGPLAEGVTIPDYSPLDWLKQELRNSGDKPVIVCHHQPSVEDFYKNTMHPGWPEENRKRWHAALQQGNVQAVLAGHFHRNELHWLGNIPLFVAEPTAAYWKRQAAFRIYEYRDGKLTCRTQYIE